MRRARGGPSGLGGLALAAFLAPALFAADPPPGGDRTWEDPVFATAAESRAAARAEAAHLGEGAPDALRHFVLWNGIVPGEGGISSSSAFGVREMGDLLVTYPAILEGGDPMGDLWRDVMQRLDGDRRLIGARLRRFDVPPPRGLVYVMLMPFPDELNAFEGKQKEGEPFVRGQTRFVRYVSLPLSGTPRRDFLEAIAQSAGTARTQYLSDWRSQSLSETGDTFRHELVHALANAAVGLPDYSDAAKIPLWFREGLATYVAGNPRATMSGEYREYQDGFLYLVRRHGLEKLRSFITGALTSHDVAKALARTFGFGSWLDLRNAAQGWLRFEEGIRTAFVVVGLLLAGLAFRRDDVPLVGALQLWASAFLLALLALGFAEAWFSLAGSTAILAGKAAFLLLAGLLAWRGLRRFGAARRRRDERRRRLRQAAKAVLGGRR